MTTHHVRRAVAGDEASLEWVVARLSPFLLCQARERLTAGLLQAHYDPEDLVQEVWRIALPRLGELSPREGRLTPVIVRFLGRTLLNACRDALKKHLTGKPPRVDKSSFAELPCDPSASIARAERSEIHRAIEEALGELTDRERAVFVLRGIEQAPNKTAAKLLDVEPNTVAVTYRRALERLRRKLPDSILDGFD